jgi:hypothetical protein
MMTSDRVSDEDCGIDKDLISDLKSQSPLFRHNSGKGTIKHT